ncbi:FAS1-like dehydratase domain-containing protein [Mameliella alba]|uniref:FAS1-like dehydratase domain-containing protein n=1 Tax=Mameliella alba TaxID=561184 RepID=UPI0021BD1C1A|nr:MaoC family dehydratase N-terminal domain-containing protein [Mameliella alba]
MKAMDMSQNHLKDWIGRTETREDRIAAFPMAALSATLDMPSDLPKDGTALPPLWHWIYFLPLYRQSEVGPDGHAQRGGFLPPVPLPRRMWAGGRFKFNTPLRAGDDVRRVSAIENVTEKSGRTGNLVFVLVRHEIFGPEGLALTEEHDIVYRDMPQPNAPAPAPVAPPADPVWTKTIVPDDVLLFRYSALTFNGHRIHYDRRYVTEVEGYPGLIVHGPLIATLLAELARFSRPEQDMLEFSFKAVAPVFDIAPFRVCGKPNEADPDELILWAETSAGNVAIEARARMRNR